jgi:hypothetical protein
MIRCKLLKATTKFSNKRIRAKENFQSEAAGFGSCRYLTIFWVAFDHLILGADFCLSAL